MIHAVASLIAVVFYLAAAAYQGTYLLNRRHPHPPRGRFVALGIIAVIAHGVSAFGTIYTAHGIDLGIYRVLSLIFWFICLIGLLGNWRRPLESALALLFPLASISIVISFALHGPITPEPDISPGVFGHIIFSILAYSVLSLSALQAIVLAIQERELKHRHTRGILNALPPLQTMEQILFELIWIGLILLTLSIATGAVYIENLFAQHLVHKTVFTIIAWCIFASLLWGHKKLGWRGHTAVRWTLIGFVALFLAYFGTKLVLELILHRT
ncbi:MAG: hypothetical protein JWM78_1227 [Verrucomicrobiaceae bacterium]|nr:hypothetical protein [Verrucomicrobiaceae bacterium]